jgi:hypothetical protein
MLPPSIETEPDVVMVQDTPSFEDKLTTRVKSKADIPPTTTVIIIRSPTEVIDHPRA